MWSSQQLAEQRFFEERLRWLAVAALAGLACLLLRLFTLQVVHRSYFVRIADQNRLQLVFERAPRGFVRDRSGKVLVENKPKFVVLFSPLKSSSEALGVLVERLSHILELPPRKLEVVLNRAMRSSTVVRLFDNVPRDKFMRLQEAKPDLPGVFVVVESQRHYPHGAFASHLLGYLGEVNEEELNTTFVDGYRLGDIVGKMGIERIYDSTLRGIDGGLQVEVDAAGRSVRFLNSVPSIPGHSVVLTVDYGLQKTAEDALRASPTGSGAVVALDPRNGEILAIASLPEFDPNIFLTKIPQDVYKAKIDNPDRPLFNRALQGLYSPGSTFKIVTATAALNKRAIKPSTVFHCPGFYVLKGTVPRTFKCWDKKGHGWPNLIQAMAHSCDVYFYNTGLRTGISALESASLDFGLGAVLGIALPGEKKGIVPSPAWKKKIFREGWYDGDTLNTSIGQGHVNVTPLQLANLIAMVASRGQVWKPVVVKKVLGSKEVLLSENISQKVRTLSLPDETWRILQQSLEEVIRSGTGVGCAVSGLVVAGKTGTVQNPHGEDHALFVAYAAKPGEEPSLAVAVLVEHGLHGASAAAPVARQMIEHYFKPEAAS